jgi:uncharacterized protein YkwD
MRVKIPVLCVLAIVLVALAAAAPAVATVRDDFTVEVLRLINTERTSRGLHTVQLDAALGRAASAHARDMMVRDYFSHTSPEGTTCATRARRAGYRTSGYRAWRIAEVIAWGMRWKGTPAEVVDGWMHSTYHRSVILGRGWRDVGVACVEGDFRGSGDSFMYTVDVGRRVP